jgi:hypothetical protein
MYEALHQRTIKIEIITGEITYSAWYQYKKNKFSHSIYTGRSCSFLTSAVKAHNRSCSIFALNFNLPDSFEMCITNVPYYKHQPSDAGSSFALPMHISNVTFDVADVRAAPSGREKSVYQIILCGQIINLMFFKMFTWREGSTHSYT